MQTIRRLGWSGTYKRAKLSWGCTRDIAVLTCAMRASVEPIKVHGPGVGKYEYYLQFVRQRLAEMERLEGDELREFARKWFVGRQELKQAVVDLELKVDHARRMEVMKQQYWWGNKL